MEELDLLERSTKKPKTFGAVEEAKSVNVVMETLSADTLKDDLVVLMGNPSFKDTWMGDMATADLHGSLEDFSFISNDEEEFFDEEDEEECPMIWLSKEEKTRLRQPWRQTLIGKVMG
ncbi:hypothetical protein PTKIN_Ptkin01aG0135700 [Pterospermum kingtungense]